MSQVTIKVRDNGPFLVEGPATIVDAAGGVFQIPAGKPAVALCRCGQSKNKPFCDNEHLRIKFVADGVPMKIHLTPVRPRQDEPISRADDPRT